MNKINEKHAPACIWNTLKVSLSNVKSSKMSTKTSNTSSSVQSASPGKLLNFWYVVDLDFPIFKYFLCRKYSPVEIVLQYSSFSSFSAVPFSSNFKIYFGSFESSDTNATNETIVTNSNTFSFWSISSALRSHLSLWQTWPDRRYKFAVGFRQF